MKTRIIEIIKGFFIGIINVIPGFSTSTMAIALGVYDKCIRAFSVLLKNPKHTLKEVWALLIGLLIGIGSSIYLIATLLNRYPAITTLFFIGLILGSIPKQAIKLKEKKTSLKYIIELLLSFSFLILLLFINTSQVSFDEFKFTITQALLLLIVGILTAAFLVMGASGTIILMALGYYEITVSLAKNVIVYSFSGQGIEALKMFLQMLPFIIGILLGSSLCSSLMKRLIDNNHMSINYIVMGLICSAPLVVFYKMIDSHPGVLQTTEVSEWIIGSGLLLVGFIITNRVGKIERNKDSKKVESQNSNMINQEENL